MELAFNLILLVVVVTAVGGAARRWDLPAPLVLLGVGVAASYLHRFNDVELDPDLVLVGLLPPLLYAAATRTSLLEFRTNFGAIASLSVGLVIATTLAVGFFAWWVLPIPLAAGLALGAVVAPPDAVAATTIARRVGLPRRVISLLEGESLVNDATALVCLTTAIAAIEGHVSPAGITWEFTVSVVGGTAIGLLVAALFGKVRMFVEDTVTHTALSLVTPFVAYLAAEEIHASGVLALVITGLILGHQSTVLQSAASRLFERSNWATVAFILEGAVFVMIGLQVRPIVEELGESSLDGGRIALAAGGVLLVAVLVRFAWVLGTNLWLQGRARRSGNSSAKISWPGATVVSWAGMRGVVTLAAAFVLPPDTPERNVLVFIALVVTGGTLVVQGITLPALIRRTGLPAPDHHQDALLSAEIHHRAAAVGLARLDELIEEQPDIPESVIARLRTVSQERADARWERLGGGAETPSEAYARLRQEMLAAEREDVLRVRSTGTVPYEVLQGVLTTMDVEESVLELVGSTSTADREVALQAPRASASNSCAHLVAAAELPEPTPGTPEGCEECLRDGTSWVHLRLCLTCGHVGCCDSSPNRHATAHFRETGHPVVRSFEPGEAWRWCYEDDQIG